MTGWWGRTRRVGWLVVGCLVAGLVVMLALSSATTWGSAADAVATALPGSLDPFAPVPTGDPAYQWLTQLRQAGLLRSVTDSSGQPPLLSRYEFAVSLAQVLQSAQSAGRVGRPNPTGSTPGADGVVGVRAPTSTLVDGHSIDTLLQSLGHQFAPQVRTALAGLLAEFAGELEVLGYHVALPSTRTGTAGVVVATSVGDSRQTVSGPGPTVVPPAEYRMSTGLTGPAGVASPLEWSYLLGQNAGGLQAGLSAPAAGVGVGVQDPARAMGQSQRWSELTVGQGTTTTVRADALAGPLAAEVDVIAPPPDQAGAGATPVVGLNARWQVSDAASLRWWWGTLVQPETSGRPALTSAGQGGMTAVGGTLAVSPQVSLEGEVARHQTADPAAAQVGASRVGASVALGDVQVGASYRWVDSGFRPLLAGTQSPTTGSSVSMQLRQNTWQLAAQLDRSQSGAAASGSIRQVVALGLTYDLNNLAVLRAGYEWSDLWGTEGGGQLTASSQRRMQVGVGVQQGSPQQGVRADLTLAGATRDQDQAFTLSTTAALEYRLLPWNARLVAGLGQLGAGMSTSLQLGYEPSADTSVWVGYQLMDYSQGEQKPDGPSNNQAQAGLTIRF